jgi:hypothetical protein
VFGEKPIKHRFYRLIAEDMHMPKLKNRPPKYCKSGNYAVVYHQEKPVYLGKYGTPESKTAYARFLAERDNPVPTAPNRFRGGRTGTTDNSITV